MSYSSVWLGSIDNPPNQRAGQRRVRLSRGKRTRKRRITIERARPTWLLDNRIQTDRASL
jgi:hypothetical protein